MGIAISEFQMHDLDDAASAAVRASQEIATLTEAIVPLAASECRARGRMDLPEGKVIDVRFGLEFQAAPTSDRIKLFGVPPQSPVIRFTKIDTAGFQVVAQGGTLRGITWFVDGTPKDGQSSLNFEQTGPTPALNESQNVTVGFPSPFRYPPHVELIQPADGFGPGKYLEVVGITESDFVVTARGFSSPVTTWIARGQRG